MLNGKTIEQGRILADKPVTLYEAALLIQKELINEAEKKSSQAKQNNTRSGFSLLRTAISSLLG